MQNLVIYLHPFVVGFIRAASYWPSDRKANRFWMKQQKIETNAT
jgi:hypothetical protein